MPRRQQSGPGVQIDYEGKTYVVRQDDMTSRLTAELRRETGFPGFIGLIAETRRGFDLDVLAAFIWLARRIDGESVTFDAVLDTVTYDVKDLNMIPLQGEESDPEA